MAFCPRCGEENPERARYCWSCGSAMQQPGGPARGMRKTVTVLFSDITGFTNLGERLDPESLRRVMTRYFHHMRSVLERHGGSVEKFIGDAVMAVFGIPLLHEDDALRAVRAGSEMLEVLSELNQELEKGWGVRIEIHTGINSGEVVAGDPDAGQRLVTGDAVSLAARLEEAAQPGEILIGESTFRLVKEYVEAEPLGPLQLKGRGEPVLAWRLSGAIPSGRPEGRRLESPLVGRENERHLLEQAFTRAVRERTCHLFTILGPAGVGKSRLAEEALGSLEGQSTVLWGRCLPYGEGITYWPVIEVVKSAAGISDADPPDLGMQKVAALLEGIEESHAIAARVATLGGLGESQAPAEEIVWSIRKLLEALARQRPLVVVFDDIHWAEETFLDLVENVADWTRDAPILMVCLARPELFDARPAWGGGKLNSTSMLLEPLTGEECDELMANLLGRSALVGEVRSRINEAAEGNPLFVEEILLMLMDDHLLTRKNGEWTAAEELPNVTVPPSIHSLLAARLDRLQGSERRVLEQAAVMGKVFWRGAVEELSSDEDRTDVPGNLMTLVRKELIRPDASTFDGEETYRFRHMLIRDAAYSGMAKEARAELHERFAPWLEKTAGDRIREYEEIVGYHLEQAHRYRAELGSMDERIRALGLEAGRRLSGAGRRALGRGDMPATVNLLSRAASLMPHDHPERIGLLPDLGTALMEVGRLDEADSILREGIDLAEAAADPRLRAHGEVARMVLRLHMDPEESTDEARQAAESAVGVFEDAGDELGLARAWRLLAEVNLLACRFGAAEEALGRAAGYAKRAGDRREEMWDTDLMAEAIAWGPTPVPEGVRRCEEMLQGSADVPVLGSRAFVALASFEAMLGRFDEARELIARGREILGDVGQMVLAAASAQTAGIVEMLAGDPEAAERELRRGYHHLERMGESAYLSSIAADLARALFAQGRLEEAEHFTRVSEEKASPEDVAAQVVLKGTRAKILARRGEHGRAEALAREAVAAAGQTDYLVMHGEACMDLADVLREAGRLDEASKAAGMALELFDRKGNVVYAAQARAAMTQS